MPGHTSFYNTGTSSTEGAQSAPSAGAIKPGDRGGYQHTTPPINPSKSPNQHNNILNDLKTLEKENPHNNNKGNANNANNNTGTVNTNNTVNLPIWQKGTDLEDEVPQADESWLTTTTKMNSWQINNDKTNTFFTGGGTTLNSKDWETQKLFDAGSKILNELGLEDNKKNMQIAMNILQGGDRIWGKTSRALENATQAQISAIAGIKGVDAQNLGKTGLWNTWGTNLRGDATWGGSPMSQNEYNDKMTVFSGNWEASSPLHKYQEVLVDGWQAANPNYKTSGSNKLGSALLTAMLPMSPAVAGVVFGARGVETAKGNLSKPTNVNEVMFNPLGAILPKGWIADPKEGVKSLYINGQEVTVNSKTVNRGDGGMFSKYDLIESDLGRDSGTNSSAPYYGNSYNIEDIPDTIDDEDTDEGESENTLTADENPAWWNFKLFETIFSPLSALKYKTGDVVGEETVAPQIVRNVIEQAKTDNQAKIILKSLVEENEQIANIVNTYDDIKKSVNDLIGPIEISADLDDLSVKAETESGFMAKADLQNKEISVQKQLGDLRLQASYNPEKKSGFLGLQKAF
jgi:hypothetical protein